MNDFGPVLIVAIVIFILGVGVGYQGGIETTHKEAIKNNVAHYGVDADGSSKFEWNTSNTLEKK